MTTKLDAKNKAMLETEIENLSTVIRTRIGVMTYLAPRKNLIEDGGVDLLQQAIKACIDSLETKIVIDMISMSVVNSQVIEALLDIQDSLVRKGGWLRIANINETINEVFKITGMDRLLVVVSNESPSQQVNSMVKTTSSQKLGEILVSKKLITEEKIQEAILLQNSMGMRLGKVIVQKGWVSEHEVLTSISQQLNLYYCKLSSASIDPNVASLINIQTAKRLSVIPLFLIRGELSLATSDPQAMPIFDEITDRLKCRIRPVVVKSENIINKINEFYNKDTYSGDLFSGLDSDLELIETVSSDEYEHIDEMAAGSPVINMVNTVIQRAVRDGASDIHIEPSRTKSLIRYRIDGVLYKAMELKPEIHAAIVSRLKVMANLDIAERRLPQDGRIQVQTQGKSVDLRFSSLPSLFGEKIVLRVLDKDQSILDVNKLGMSKVNLESFKNLLGRNFGLILVTGPTGSGKTTSLYAAMNYLNSMEKNIVTIEDPVEYQVDIINQNQVKENIGLGFATILKHILRQDPDIIMVGEIREKETAEIAVQAALTGHLVLSTLHTNDSIGAVTRLIEMGVEPYLLSSALIGVVAQRLIRTVCNSCKTSYLASPEIIEKFSWDSSKDNKLVKGRGCPECYDSGYKGRIGVYELLETTEELQKLIISNPGRDGLNDYLNKKQVKSLFEDGLLRVLDGRTTLEEISRVTI